MQFDLTSPKHLKTKEYIDKQYEGFMVRTEPDLLKVLREYRVKTVEGVRKKMMQNGHSAPIIQGRMLLPFDHHKPGEGHFEGDFFYWDNYWSVKWAVMKGDYEFAKGIIDNWKYEFKYYGYVPNSNRKKISNRTQPPVGTLAYRELAPHLPDTEKNKAWKQDTLNYLKSEYLNAWVDDPEAEANYLSYGRYHGKHSDVWIHQAHTPTGLSRYSGADLPRDHYAAEAASGEDCTPRFKGRCADFNPTDLQGLLGTYEKLFTATAETVEEQAHWESQYERRKQLVNTLMWNEEKGWYMDWDHKNNKQSDVMALAPFTLALAGIVPPERFDRMVNNLQKFTLPYGLAVTTGEETSLPEREEQWKWPNVWPPREGFVFDALIEYPEYDTITEDLIISSMVGSAEFCARYDSLPETRDGRTGDLGGMSLYARDKESKGFLWTAVEYLANEKRLERINNRKDLH